MRAVIEASGRRLVRPLRLLAVIGVLAGVMVAHGVQCQDGVHTALAADGAGHVTAGSLAAGSLAAGSLAADTDEFATGGHGRPDQPPGGLLITCITLLIGVVGVILLLARSGRRRIVGIPAVARRRVEARASRSALTLAQLGLLRT